MTNALKVMLTGCSLPGMNETFKSIEKLSFPMKVLLFIGALMLMKGYAERNMVTKFINQNYDASYHFDDLNRDIENAKTLQSILPKEPDDPVLAGYLEHYKQAADADEKSSWLATALEHVREKLT
jgi:hypothetical protein